MSDEAAHAGPPQPPVAPYLTVDRGVEAMDWYKRGLHATELSRQLTPDGQKLVHGALLINGGLVLVSDDFAENDAERSSPAVLGGSTVTIHLVADDVDNLYNSAVAAGAAATMPLADMFWGSRYGQLTDPFGHRWSMGTPQGPVTQADLDKGTAESFPKHG
ncbi:MAG: glyoxalase/bleomycin resistance/extradiol dioxygenase family protein [Tepidiformaceae bacterium]